MSKTIVVATVLQKELLEQLLIDQMTTGFWKSGRPADHAQVWADVQVVVGQVLGPVGFSIARNYNFVNPDFFKHMQGMLMDVAVSVNSEITVKQLKKQLIALNQILGGRLRQIGGDITKLSRGKKDVGIVEIKRTARASVRKVPANIQEQLPAVA